MIYRSNLTAPDLRQHFKLAFPSREIMGHEAPSDPNFEPDCTFWTDDEAAILYHVARQVGGDWLDLGARFGWTSRYILEAGAEEVFAVDRAYEDVEFRRRAMDQCPGMIQVVLTAQKYLKLAPRFFDGFDGFVIDADHDAPQPLLDALGCEKIAKPDAVILMHDFWGRPIQDAVERLMQHGWRCRIYSTPNGVALLWRTLGPSMNIPSSGPLAHFRPPDHVPDPTINWAEVRRGRAEGFRFERTE